MIVKMIKFEFLVFYDAYDKFLAGIQEIGILHVKPQNNDSTSADLTTMLKSYQEVGSALNKLTLKQVDEHHGNST